MNRLTTLALLACLIAWPAWADGDDAPQRTVSVSGTITTKVAPDIIVWHITAKTHDPDLAKAKAESDAKLKLVLGMADELDVKKQDVQTGHLSIRKVYNRDRQGNRLDFRYYEITRNVTLRQRDLKQFEQFFTALVGSKDIEAYYTLESSTFHDVRMDTRLKAAAMAKRKAKMLAEALDAKLGPVTQIQEHVPGNPWRGLASNNSISNGWAGGGGNANFRPDEAGGTFAPGAIEIKVTVHVTFALK